MTDAGQSGRSAHGAVAEHEPEPLEIAMPVALHLAVAAILIPACAAHADDRSFTFWQLCLAMPDLVIFLAVAALTGTVVASGRVIRIRSARAASAGRPPTPA